MSFHKRLTDIWREWTRGSSSAGFPADLLADNIIITSWVTGSRRKEATFCRCFRIGSILVPEPHVIGADVK